MNPKISGAYSANWRIARAGNSAVGLHLKGIVWLGANDSDTDGVVPSETAIQLGTQGEIDALLEVGLWEKVVTGEQLTIGSRSGPGRESTTIVAPCDGFFVPDFLKLNRTRDEQETFIASQRRKSLTAASARKKSTKRGRDTSRGAAGGGDEKLDVEKRREDGTGSPAVSPSDSPADHPSGERTYGWEPNQEDKHRRGPAPSGTREDSRS